MNRNYLLYVIIALLLVAIGLIVWQPWIRPPAENTADTPSAAPVAEALAAAADLQQRQQWRNAVDAWDALLRRSDLTPEQRAEVQRSLAEALNGQAEMQSLAEAASQLQADAPAPLPRPAPREEFLKYYPAGRRARSVSLFNATGEGTNQRWLFSRQAYFAYQYKVPVDSRVLTNDGEQLKIEVKFGQVMQLSAVSSDELELKIPEDAPILELVWQQADQALAKRSVLYKTVRQLIDVVDPNLKRSLSTLNEYLKKQGLPLTPEDEIQWSSKFESLANAHLRITYDRQFGVTDVQVQGNRKLPKQDLQRLLFNSGVLMDYFVFPSAEKEVGASWSVDARDVAGLFAFYGPADLQGGLDLQRREDTARDGEMLAQLQVVGGNVLVEVELDGTEQTMNVAPTDDAVILFSERDLMVRHARIQWKLSELRLSRDHLLFGTRDVLNLNVESIYQAKNLKP